MSYILHCLSCNGKTELHDSLEVGMCPKCGIAIIAIAQEDNTIICDKHRFVPMIHDLIKKIYVKQYKECLETI